MVSLRLSSGYGVVVTSDQQRKAQFHLIIKQIWGLGVLRDEPDRHCSS